MLRPRRRILLVDDYADALETWGLFLELHGYEVLTAGDGQTAVDLALSSRPDIIVMDLDLPGLSGFDAARLLRQRAETAAIPLIAATGYSHGRQLDEARQVGFDSLLVKPCDPDRLLREIVIRLVAADGGGQERADSGNPDAHSGPAPGQ